ncbi:helix-turn-helix domain-containing protein [Clostridium manihotivorum]|uniref:AraC family transcriptional regulator n=1 Tax=Clostridium manihotivorum TaxID=2320868 RepID=A0A410DN38_9CLOT|nr:helix-turn-helix domain-containing protein [Clostridium manihotivorum]QAA30469.1 AraC family transcriptional regulator [Clostridium manihotivorum]
MDWQKSMNQALDYIEDNLSYDIDYNIAAKIMNCSECEFRRVFSLLAQIPLSEYIRLRRLAMAAIDIKRGEKIIDVAIRYGYESQAAFSRAFSRFHGIAPSFVRDDGVTTKTFPRLTFKLILMEGNVMKKDPNHRTNIIGAGEVSYAISVDMDKNNIHKINSSFWDTKGNEVIGTTALPKYGAFISEEKCHLFGDVSGKKLLEIGCGIGNSLRYHGDRKASELWGIDISEKQIEKAREYLSSKGLSANLICSPMEEDCGIPVDYFDFVYSIYGVGWTTDLEGTFSRIATYLKKDGVFIFSWSHPIHKCVAMEDDLLSFKKSYFDESWYSVPLEGGAISLADRKLSTYINALTKAGFIIDQMVEESDDDIIQLYKDSDFAKKAKMLPVTFVIKARKL